MSTRKLLEDAAETLEAAGVSSPRHDAEVLLSHVTGTPRSLLTLTVRADDAQRQVFQELIVARAAAASNGFGRLPLRGFGGRARRIRPATGD